MGAREICRALPCIQVGIGVCLSFQLYHKLGFEIVVVWRKCSLCNIASSKAIQLLHDCANYYRKFSLSNFNLFGFLNFFSIIDRLTMQKSSMSQ